MSRAVDGVTELEWAIKNTFLSYIESMPDSSVTCADGASRAESGAFRFPIAEAHEDEDGSTTYRFRGSVTLKAHGGMLLVIFMDPWLTISTRGTELSVVDLMRWPDISRRETLGSSSDQPRRVSDTVSEAPLALAPTAVETFNSVYPPGTELAPAVLRTP